MSLQLNLNPDVVCSPLDDGGVLFDLATKQYFALNASALAIWKFLEDGGSMDAVESALQSAPSGAPASRLADPTISVRKFAQALVDHELATLAPGAGSITETRPMALTDLPRPWVPPSLAPHGRPLAQVILSPFDPTVPVPE
jgi:hypothetical protein